MGKKRKLARGVQKAERPSIPAHKKSESSKPKASTPPSPARSQPPTIPFAPDDSILLVGEGDLSFAASLVEHHVCGNVTATVLESKRDELVEKYPHAAENIDKIEAEGGKVVYGVDARKMGPWAHKRGKEAAVGTMDRIMFNFPHKDVAPSWPVFSLPPASRLALLVLHHP